MLKRQHYNLRLQLQPCMFLVVLAAYLGSNTAVAVERTVGPGQTYSTIQAAIDAAIDGDTITVYRNTGSPANDCYDEHITVDVPNLTVQGASASPASAACIGPTSGGHIVTITASGVTLKDLEVSGKAGALDSYESGGRADGHGVYILGNDVSGVTIQNCTVSYTYMDNIGWNGDRDDDGSGGVTIKKCYIHHADHGRNIRIFSGGLGASDEHLIQNNLIHTGQGILVQDHTGSSTDINYVTVKKNIIKGWPYSGVFGGGPLPNYPEYGPGCDQDTTPANGIPDCIDNSETRRGWKYYSISIAGVWVASGGSNMTISNNLIIDTRRGIRVETTGTIKNNTIVNPFNMAHYDPSADAATRKQSIRDYTYGIMLVSGFSGTVQNNVVVVEAENRSAGYDGYSSSSSPPYYTPGITGYGIAFVGGSGSLSGATINNNNVWGFVDTDGSTSTNWGTDLTTCGTNAAAECNNNVSKEPRFASDTSDDTDNDPSRPYDTFEDNYFHKSKHPTASNPGSCHADVKSNTHGDVGFVDIDTTGNSNDDQVAGLGDCSIAEDTGEVSPCIDWGYGTPTNEPGKDGDAVNLGAFGDTDRASGSGTLRIIGITAGDGSVKRVDGVAVEGYSGPGVVQPRSAGLVELKVDFNRGLSASSSSFVILDNCGDDNLTAPTFDFSETSSPPYRVTMTWLASTFNNQWIRIHALGDGVDRIVDLEDSEALDGEFSDLFDGTVPGGDNILGGDGEFIIGSLVGDVDGDGAVEGLSGEDDRDSVTNYPGYPGGSCSGCPEDVDGDGDVDAQDRNVVSGSDDNFLVRAESCPPVKIWDNTTSLFTATFANGDSIDTGNAASAHSLSVAVGSQNQPYVSYVQKSGSREHIFLSRYDGTDVKIWDNGASVWTDTFNQGDPIDLGINQNASEPQVALDTSDRAYVTFLQLISNRTRLHLTRYDGTDVKIWDNGASAWTDTFENGDPIDNGSSDNVSSPVLAADSQDRVYLAFVQSTSNKTRLYLSRYDGTDVKIWDNDTSAWTDTFTDADPIDTGASQNVTGPQIAIDTNDYVYIAFSQSDGSNDHIYLTRYDGTDVKIWDNGASAWTDTFTDGDPIDMGTANNTAEPVIEVDPSDRIYVAYRQSDGSNDHIYLSRYDGTDVKIWDNGASAWTDTFSDGDPLDTGTANNAAEPAIADDPSGRIYLTFRQSDGSNDHIYLSRFDGSDAEIWDNDTMAWTDTFANGDPIDTGTANNAAMPKVAVDSSNRVFVVFKQWDGSNDHIYISRYDGIELGIWDSDSFAWVDIFSGGDPIDTNDTQDADTPAIVTDLLERVYLPFQQEGSGNKTHIYLSRY